MRLSLFALIDQRFAPPPAPGRAAWIGRTCFAHRGLHGPGVPENSPCAFAAAIARGLGIECDVQRSADGRAVVFHDWELDRLTAEAGPVDGRDAQHLARIQLAGSTERIPSLRQLLQQVDGRVPLLIEVKSRRGLPVGELCSSIRQDLADYRGENGVMSFDPRISRWFARNSPDTLRGLVVTEDDGRGMVGTLRRRLAFWYAAPEFLAYDIRDLPSPFPASQRQRGLPVAAWTVGTPELREKARRHADAPIAEGAGIEQGL
jgi:glycerophosphoryl diester phosphodiesterase